MKNVFRKRPLAFSARHCIIERDQKEAGMKDIRDIEFPTLTSTAFDRTAIRKEYLRQQAHIAVKNLERNNFSSHFCDSLEEAHAVLLELIPDDTVIGCGDSHTLFALEVDTALKNRGCTVIPHTCAANSQVFEKKPSWATILGDRQTTKEILRNYLCADVFILGANAVTLDGQIVNLDGAGNRIAGSIYGADRIIVIAGANKIVKDLNAALDRIHDVAAQMNNIKYGKELPCNKVGHCVDCRSEERDCNITSIIHRRPEEADFHVIMIAEEIGF